MELIESEKLLNEPKEKTEDGAEADDDVRVESNISKIVSESITKILIIIIMGMIFFIPLLDWTFWKDPQLDNYNNIANYIEYFEDQVFPISLNRTLKNFILNSYDRVYPILNITYDNLLYWENITSNNETYRREDVGVIVSDRHVVQVYYLVVQKNDVDAIISLTRTLFICLVLVISSLMFEGDANDLVLRPLDVMTDIVQKVVHDPIGAKNLDAMSIIQEDEKQKEKLEKENEGVKESQRVDSKENNGKSKEVSDYEKELERKEKEKEEVLEENAEVKVIQKSIIKISALLAIGFGEAGADIIRTNLKSSSDLDPMLPGVKKTAFMGFCDIRSFLEVNQALKEDSVIFVNRVAEIVHKSVDKFGGATNKNIGDAFLNVWKFPDLNSKKEKYEASPSNIFSKTVADKAVLSFLYVIRAIKCTQDILDYSEDVRIIEAFEKKGGYKVNMGFGLHYGWAIEGTIGSKHKIDASYLSPNVNISARLEAATRQYGVTILISGVVWEFLSEELKAICREIDRVTVKGSLEPIRLFTIDVNLKIPSSEYLKKKKEGVSSTEKTKKILEKKILYKSYYDKVDSLVALNFRTSFFLKNLSVIFQDKMSDTFYDNFSYGFEKYIEGKWLESSKYLKKCLKLYPDDGPTQNLLNYLESNNNIAPNKWVGVRELTSK